jgi:hypothetical protein
LLGRLVEGVNHHLQIRPRIVFISKDADTQSAAAAARGIKDCFTRCIELLSTDEDRAGNVAAFTVFLMDSDDDAETSMRIAFLDMITRRVVAVKRPGQRWDATVDGETVGLDEGCSACGSNAAIAPVLQFASAAAAAAAACGNLEDFDDAKCTICLCTSFDSRSDGSVSINVREMKCPGRHTFHSQCARRWFVNEKHNSCPYCRHDFSGSFCDDITATLQHQVEPTGTGFTVHWSKPPNLRLAALNVLLLFPPETPLGSTIAHALLWSCFDAAAGIADAALRCGRLSVAMVGMPQGEVELWCARLVEAFTIAAMDTIKANVAMAICDFASNEEGRTGLAAAGGCGALVEALKVAEADGTRDSIAFAMCILALSEEGRTGLAAAGACGALVEALKVAEADATRRTIASAMTNLTKNEEGRNGLAAAGAGGTLEIAEHMGVGCKRSIAEALDSLQPHHQNKTAKFSHGAS